MSDEDYGPRAEDAAFKNAIAAIRARDAFAREREAHEQTRSKVPSWNAANAGKAADLDERKARAWEMLNDGKTLDEIGADPDVQRHPDTVRRWFREDLKAGR
jgi:hypothetical protein